MSRSLNSQSIRLILPADSLSRLFISDGDDNFHDMSQDLQKLMQRCYGSADADLVKLFNDILDQHQRTTNTTHFTFEGMQYPEWGWELQTYSPTEEFIGELPFSLHGEMQMFLNFRRDIKKEYILIQNYLRTVQSFYASGYCIDNLLPKSLIGESWDMHENDAAETPDFVLSFKEAHQWCYETIQDRLLENMVSPKYTTD